MNPTYDFAGQVALVTGAAMGMGLATARAFAQSGAAMLEDQSEAMAEIMKSQVIGRLGRADQVAAAVLWLCSPGASFVIGVGLPVDGSFTAH